MGRRRAPIRFVAAGQRAEVDASCRMNCNGGDRKRREASEMSATMSMRIGFSGQAAIILKKEIRFGGCAV